MSIEHATKLNFPILKKLKKSPRRGEPSHRDPSPTKESENEKNLNQVSAINLYPNTGSNHTHTSSATHTHNVSAQEMQWKRAQFDLAMAKSGSSFVQIYSVASDSSTQHTIHTNARADGGFSVLLHEDLHSFGIAHCFTHLPSTPRNLLSKWNKSLEQERKRDTNRAALLSRSWLVGQQHWTESYECECVRDWPLSIVYSLISEKYIAIKISQFSPITRSPLNEHTHSNLKHTKDQQEILADKARNKWWALFFSTK